MASIILAAAGTAIGGSIGGSILGVSRRDDRRRRRLDRRRGHRLLARRLDGADAAHRRPAARHPADHLLDRGRGDPARLRRACASGGNIIWATDFREETETTRQGGGGKGGGGGGGTEVTEYFYFASFAVALCEGPITGIGRIWADGKPMNLDGVTMRCPSRRRGPGARSVHRGEDGRGEHAGLSRHGLCRLRGAAARALRQPAAAALLRGVPPDPRRRRPPRAWCAPSR